MITRRSLADTIDAYDAEIEAHQISKRETFEAYRAQLADDGHDKAQVKVEIEATKAAIKRRRAIGKDRDAVEEKDALVDEITAEICRPEATGTTSALRVARSALPATPHDPTTGEVLDEAPATDIPSAPSHGLTGGQPSPPSPDSVPAADDTTHHTASSSSGQSERSPDPIPDLTDAEWITHPDAAPLREAGAAAFRNGVSFRACPHGDPLTPPLSAAIHGWTVGWWIAQGASAAAQGLGTDACRSSAGTLARLAWMAGWERGQIAEAAE